MKSLRALLPVALLGSLALASCQSAAPRVVAADAIVRDALFTPLTALVGVWEGRSDEMPLRHEFALTAGGSAVREIMFPGEDHEMTNLYALDGNSLVMTHYCGAGNQPTMRATSIVGGVMRFAFESIADLKSADAIYMGDMTLKIIDENHIEQHWNSLRNGELDHVMVMNLTRVN